MKLSPLILLLALPCLGQTTNCVTPPAGLVSWWRGETNGYDSFGNNNGTLMSTVYFEPGMDGNCFHFVSGFNPRVYVPDNPSLVLTNSLTMEAWIKINLGYWIVDRGDDVIGEVPYGLGLVGERDTRLSFILHATQTDWVDLLTAPLPTNVWLHVAGTLDDATGDMRIYVNGQIVAQTNTSIRATCPLTGANHALCIGNASGTAGFPFDGWIDEVSLYSRALSQAEIQAIYNAGSAGKCVSSRPNITLQPQGQVGFLGGSVTFSVRATGSAPLSYLWFKDSFPITWATDTNLVLTNLSLADGGTYSVVVSNNLGSVTSSNAFLTVNPAGVSLGIYPGLTVQGTTGRVFGIQYATNVAPNSTWLTLTQFTLVQPSQMWFDADNNISSGNNPRRFYRVVAIPY
jgi:hypothetical protein